MRRSWVRPAHHRSDLETMVDFGLGADLARLAEEAMHDETDFHDCSEEARASMEGPPSDATVVDRTVPLEALRANNELTVNASAPRLRPTSTLQPSAVRSTRKIGRSALVPWRYGLMGWSLLVFVGLLAGYSARWSLLPDAAAQAAVPASARDMAPATPLQALDAFAEPSCDAPVAAPPRGQKGTRATVARRTREPSIAATRGSATAARGAVDPDFEPTFRPSAN